MKYLNIKQLFELFKLYYKEKTGINCQMKYVMYFKFFKSNCNYGFRHPKTDLCDDCVKYNKILEVNDNDPCKLDFILHKRKVDAYLAKRQSFIADGKNDETVLTVEFYYAQNLPIPKLNTTKQFYKRLLWLYLFNIHVHNDSSSYFYSLFGG